MSLTKIPYAMTDTSLADAISSAAASAATAAAATAKSEAIAAASIKLPGDVVQVVNFQTGAAASGAISITEIKV